MSQTVATHIEIRPNRAGQPRAFIAGTRVRVQEVHALAELQGYTPSQIVEGIPHLTLGQVHAALSYYHDHAEEIQEEVKEDDDFLQEFRKMTGPGPLEQRGLRLPDYDGA